MVPLYFMESKLDEVGGNFAALLLWSQQFPPTVFVCDLIGRMIMEELLKTEDEGRWSACKNNYFAYSAAGWKLTSFFCFYTRC